MKAKERILPALVFSVFAAFGAAEAQSAQFSNVYVFGDSLSDAGYFRPFLRTLLPVTVADAMGRFTTNPGPVWSELVASYYGVNPRPSNAGGTIYAQGGARVTGTPGVSTPPGQAERPISTQVNEFLAANPVADPNALYTMWAGANDLFFNLGAFQAGAISQAQLQTNVLAAATAEIQQIARLRAAGARYIMVVTLPDIGAAPAFAGSAVTAGAVTALSGGYNTTLLTGLASAGIRVIPVDSFSLNAEIRANPGSFGISNVTGIACGPFPPITTATSVTSLFCNPTTLTAAGADRTYLFADSVHPTSAAHAIIAQFAESLIEGPTQYGLLAEAALRTRASQVRTIGDGLATARQSDIGQWSVFAGADGGDFNIDAGTGNSGVTSRTRSGTFGVTARVSEAVTIGGAYGQSRNRGSLGGNAGGYHATENVWSLFASAKWGGFYGTGILSYADLEFDNMQRNIQLGTGLRTAVANAEGANGSAYFTVGYDIAVGRLTIGPTVAVLSQNVDVNGFDESGAGAANLRIHQQKRRSEVWSAGLRASYDLGGWRPWLRVTADKERRDDVRLVTATPLTLVASGSSYDVPAYASDTDFITAAIGITGRITPRVGLSVAAFKVQGRSGIEEGGVNAMVSVRF
ncbi:MAG: autotransporter domain-containing protein [Usitatibacter sp.]